MKPYNTKDPLSDLHSEEYFWVIPSRLEHQIFSLTARIITTTPINKVFYTKQFRILAFSNSSSGL